MYEDNAQTVISVSSVPAPMLDVYSITSEGKTIYVKGAYLIRLLSAVFRVPFKILVPPDKAYGVRLPDGNWTGMLGMVKRAEVDLASDIIALTEERFLAFNFSYPYSFSELTFITNKPQPISGSLTLLYPFSFTLWITLAIFIMLVSFLFCFLIKKKENYCNVLFKVFGSILQQPINFKSRKIIARLSLILWIISSIIISNSYKAFLLAFLSVPSLVGIRNIQDLAEASDQNSVACYTYKGSFATQDFLKSGIDSWKSIGVCLQRNDEKLSFSEYPHKKAFIGDKQDLKHSYNDTYFISEESFFNVMYAIPVSNNFCCLKLLNEKLQRLFAAGFFQLSFHVSYKSNTVKKLDMQDLKGAFLLLIFGNILAFVVFLIEITISTLSPNKK